MSKTEQQTSDQDKAAKTKMPSKVIKQHVTMAIGGGLIPVPYADMVAVTAVQIKMLHALAKMYDVPFKKTLAKTVTASLFGSIIPRYLGHSSIGSLLKAIPVVGTYSGSIVMSTFSGASTYALGRVFSEHFASGGNFLDIDPHKVSDFFKKAYEEGKNLAN